MIWICFSGDRMSPVLIFEQEGIESDEYIDIFYDELLSMVDDILQSPEDANTIQGATENTFLFMHDNASCHKTEDVCELF